MTVREFTDGIHGTLTVAVGFDDQSEALMQSAVSFGRRFGYRLRLVNVIEGPDFDPLSVDIPGYYSIPPVVRLSEQRIQVERQDRMRALLEKIPPEIKAEGRILHGDGPRVLIADAVASRSSAIMTACNLDSYRLIPSGFSMALTLMHDAPLPVIVVSKEAVLDFGKPGFSVLLNDDLQESTREAARRAYELAAAVPGSRLRHLHVHGDFRELIRDTWMDIVERNPVLKASNETPDSVWLTEYNMRLEKMRKQGDPFAVAAEENGVVIERDVRTGKVHEEVHAAVEEFSPDLIFYGRHRFWRARPFLIGRMPFRSMLEEKRAVCMVPAREDMYAAISLP
jgi:nucleotide-binding universal stress UspA family protein